MKTAPEVIAIDDDPEASQQSSLDASLDDGSCEQTGDESEVKRLAQELLKKWKDLKVSGSQEYFQTLPIGFTREHVVCCAGTIQDPQVEGRGEEEA